MASPAKLTMPLPIAGWMKKLGIGLVLCGPWSFVALALIEKGAIGSRAVDELLAWGPALVLLVGLYALIEKWAPRVLAKQAQAIAANQKLADSVTMMAERGDRDTRELLIMQKYFAQELRNMGGTLEAIRREVIRK